MILLVFSIVAERMLDNYNLDLKICLTAGQAIRTLMHANLAHSLLTSQQHDNELDKLKASKSTIINIAMTLQSTQNGPFSLLLLLLQPCD